MLRLCETKVDTSFVLSCELCLSKQTIYNAIHALNNLELVVTARPLNLGRRGVKTTLYAIFGYERDENSISKAVERDRLARTPVYSEVLRITQILLNDYRPKISKGNIWSGEVYKERVSPIVKRECKGVMSADVLPLVYVELRKKGLAVI